MEAIGEMNELLTTKMCSPVIVYGVVFVISVISVYLCRDKLKDANMKDLRIYIICIWYAFKILNNFGCYYVWFMSA